jgi:glycosyltransferase involved in cell wall biosynthesis
MVSSIHVLGSHQLGGADRFFARLVEALHRAGHPSLAVIRADSPVCDVLPPDIEQVHLPMASKWDLYSRWRLTRLIRERQPEVVQSYMGRATRLTRLPAGSHALHVARLGGYYKIDGYYRHAHAWVGNTQDICDFLIKEGLPRERVFYIGNFVPQPRAVSPEELRSLRAHLALPDNAFVIFTLGRMVAKKGFQDLLEAFARLEPRVGDRPLVLLIAGDGAQREPLGEAARQLGVASRVHWAGWQNDTAPYFALGDVFVCPSRHEPLGNVILEAWQHSLPLLSTRNEGAQSMVREGENGLLAPLSDPPGLAEAMQRMLALSDAERERLAKAGHATVQREHREDAVVAAYLALYEQLRRERGMRPLPSEPPQFDIDGTG